MTTKKIKLMEDRINDLEDWVTDIKDSHDSPMIMENYNFLLTTIRQYVAGTLQMREQLSQMQQVTSENSNLFNEFIKKHSMDARWEAFLEKKKEEEKKENEQKEEIDDGNSEETSTENETEILTTDG